MSDPASPPTVGASAASGSPSACVVSSSTAPVSGASAASAAAAAAAAASASASARAFAAASSSFTASALMTVRGRSGRCGLTWALLATAAWMRASSVASYSGGCASMDDRRRACRTSGGSSPGAATLPSPSVAVSTEPRRLPATVPTTELRRVAVVVAVVAREEAAGVVAPDVVAPSVLVPAVESPPPSPPLSDASSTMSCCARPSAS